MTQIKKNTKFALATAAAMVASLPAFAVESPKYSSATFPHAVYVDADASTKLLLPFVNANISSLVYSLWTNQIRNGSGNKSKLLTNPTPAGYFSQILQLSSSYDLYYTHALRRIQAGMQHGQSVRALVVAGAVSGRAPFTKLEGVNGGALVSLMENVYGSLAPLGGIEPRAFAQKDFKYENGGVVFQGGALKKEIGQSLAEKYHEIIADGRPGGANQAKRLAALGMRYFPLATRLETQIHPLGTGEWKTYTRFEAVFPGIGLLDRGENPNDLRMWTVAPIVIDLEKEQKTITNEFAKITEIRYEGASQKGIDNFSLVRFVLEKDFAKIDDMTLTADFGRQGGQGESNEVVNMHLGRIEDGVQLNGKPILPKAIQEWPKSVLPWKKKIGEVAQKLIDNTYLTVSIQKLVMDLKRKPSASVDEAFANDYPFVQSYNREKSQLGFRMKFRVEKGWIGEAIKWAVDKIEDAAGIEYGRLVCNPENADGQAPYMCAKNFANQKGYNDWMNRLMMSLVKKEVNEGVVEKLPEFQAQMDTLLGDLATKVIESFSMGKRLVEEAAQRTP